MPKTDVGAIWTVCWIVLQHV